MHQLGRKILAQMSPGLGHWVPVTVCVIALFGCDLAHGQIAFSPRTDVVVTLHLDEVFKIAEGGFNPGTYNHELRYTIVNSSSVPVCVMTHAPLLPGQNLYEVDRIGVAASVDDETLYFWDPTADDGEPEATIHRIEPGDVKDIRLTGNGALEKINLNGGHMERTGIMESCP